MKDPLSLFRRPVREWFRSALGEPTRAQTLGWPSIARGESTLLLAPTGSGKTLAAFLAALDRLAGEPEPPKAQRCRVLYVSPLKALAVDIERNLRAPIAGISEMAHRGARGEGIRVPTVFVRTGDTPAADRARMVRTPPDILITTPESLYLLLTSDGRIVLESVDTVIVDEIHALLPTKRGAHLMLSLERLEALTAKPLQRIGLSATQRPLDEVTRFLGGFTEGGEPRPVTAVDAQQPKPLDLQVVLPDVDLTTVGEPAPAPTGGAAGKSPRRSIWPKLHEELVARIKAHRTTMVFVNSRRLAERLASALNDLAGEEIALAHHGSVAREKRADIEDRLKRGTLPAIVATSSLELGIDMGAVDLVVQIEAPPSVASGLQRIGRACHEVGGTPRGILLPKHRGDLLAAAAVTARMRKGLVEETAYPRNPLDVLAQQLVAACAVAPQRVDALYNLFRRAAPFAELPRAAFEGVLDMLSGRYPDADFADLRPRITWDRVGGGLKAREGAKRLAVTNGGTIPDRGLYGVFLADGAEKPREGGRRGGKRVGELDEEMVFEMREGDVFLLGASAWRAAEITHDRVLVTPATGEQGKMPFWHGDRPGRPRELGTAIGALVRTLAAEKPASAAKLLVGGHDLDPAAAKNLVQYVHEQVEVAGVAPTDRTLVVERFTDEVGDHRVCVLSPFGTRVHAPWAMAVLTKLRASYPGDVEGIWSDDGMVFRVPASGAPPDGALFFPASDDVERQVTAALGDTSLFAARFREAAGRALLLPRRSPQRRTPLWAQRKRAADLLAVASRHPGFPMVLEAYRECLREVFDLPGLVDTLRRVEQRRIRVATVDTQTASPFAATLQFSFVANFIYDADAPAAERRLQALSIDHAQLRELLGETELRRLLDGDVLVAHEEFLQRVNVPLKSADGLHDLLLWLGPLGEDEIRRRAPTPAVAKGWLKELLAARRVLSLPWAGARTSPRYAAAEDAGRLRDALGIAPPRGFPAAFLERAPHALTDLLSRHARTHGPFTAADAARHLGVTAAAVEDGIVPLLRAGRVVEGAFRPGGEGRELCDVEVLRALRQKSLARLRREVEPVDPTVFARFLPVWQGAAAPARSPDALLAAVTRLEGCSLPASSLERSILPARIDGFRPWDLDAACASGEVVWVGLEAMGPGDGRVALYLAEHEALLSPPPRETPGELPRRVRDILKRRGAVFFHELARTLGGFPQAIVQALWEMIWCGEVTNDTLEPLRSLRTATKSKASPRGREPRLPRPPRGGPPGSEGRWSLRAARLEGAGAPPTETERRTALVRSLLDRYGIVTREVAQAEGLEGGFSAVYDVLKAMEESGRVRRGYFIAGRGGAQFALPGADERLRLARDERAEDELLVLAAVDPANPYGASLPWPDAPGVGARPQRVMGARVILHRGALVGFVGWGSEGVLTFLPPEEPAREASVRALVAGVLLGAQRAGRRSVLVSTLDGEDARRHAATQAFLDAGFSKGAAGLLHRGRDDEGNLAIASPAEAP